MLYVCFVSFVSFLTCTCQFYPFPFGSFTLYLLFLFCIVHCVFLPFSVLLMASSTKKCHVAVLLFPSSDTDSVLERIRGLSTNHEVIFKLLPICTIPEAFSAYWECCRGFQKPVSPQCILTTASPLLIPRGPYFDSMGGGWFDALWIGPGLGSLSPPQYPFHQPTL